jgi:hypothetical protein
MKKVVETRARCLHPARNAIRLRMECVNGSDGRADDFLRPPALDTARGHRRVDVFLPLHLERS